MTTPEQRLAMAKAIVDFEARRDNKGRLIVYRLPPGDGGGAFEVAGINERYDRPQAIELRRLINEGKYDEAEQKAAEYIALNTDPAAKLTNIPAVEFYLRDMVFNRGIMGATKILQHALGQRVDGVPGPRTKAALAEAIKEPDVLLDKMRDAREWYERHVVGVRPRFWQGLVNRWNNALRTARTFGPAPTRVATPQSPVPSAPPTPFPEAHQQSWWLENVMRGAGAMRRDTPPVEPPDPKPAPLPDTTAQHDLGQRVKRTMLAKGYPWFTGHGELNVVSIEGMDPDGTPNANRVNAFDDIKMLLNGDGEIVGGPWEGTTQPGKFWTEHPMNPGGAFIIALGPQACWTPGPYHGHTVWRQAADSPIWGTRDAEENYQREGPPQKFGNIGVHHHGGYDLPRGNISRAAAGCQVIRLTDEQADFMEMTMKDPRYLADKRGFRLTATVLQAKDLADQVSAPEVA